MKKKKKIFKKIIGPRLLLCIYFLYAFIFFNFNILQLKAQTQVQVQPQARVQVKNGPQNDKGIKYDYPFEYSLLIKGILNFSWTPQEMQKINATIDSLQNILPRIPQKYIYLIIKSETYKELIESLIPTNPNGPNLNAESIKSLNLNLMKNLKEYNTFARWFIESLQTDIWDLQANPKAIPNKQKILLPWYQTLVEKGPEHINQLFKQIMLKILDKIQLSAEIFLNMTPYGSMEQLKNVKMNNENLKAPLQNEKAAAKNFNLDEYQILKRKEAERIIQHLDDDEENTQMLLQTQNLEKVLLPQYSQDAWRPKEDLTLIKTSSSPVLPSANAQREEATIPAFENRNKWTPKD